MARHSFVNNKKSYKIIIALAVIVFTALIIINNLTSSKVAYAASSSEIVMEASSKRVLNGTNIHARLPMASTTKAMTALVIIEKCNLSDVVTIPKAAVGIEGSSIYLREGEKLTVKELLYGLMLRSGNDAATALAIHAGGSVEGFAAIMNTKAKSLGLKDTNFVNPHGLHNPNHYTSAYDLGVIACEGMLNEDFRQIVSTKSITISGNNEEQTRYLYNKNKILSGYIGGNGVKTGFTKNAGRCLISSAKREGMQTVAVVLNCPDMWERCSSLMDYAFNNYHMQELANKNTKKADIAVRDGKISSAEAFIQEEFYYPIKRNGSDKVEFNLEAAEFITAPHKKENSIGKFQIKVNNCLLFESKLYTMNDVEKKTFKDKLKDFFKGNNEN